MAGSSPPQVQAPPAAANWADHVLQELRAIQVHLDRQDGRLDRLDSRVDRQDGRLDRLGDRLDQLAERMVTYFRWTAGLVLVGWLGLAGLLFPPMLQLQAAVAGMRADIAALKADMTVVKADIATVKRDIR